MCDGLCAVDVPPSPNVHDQAVGALAEVSVNVTACPAVGWVGAKVNAAAGTVAVQATPTGTCTVAL